MGFKGATKGSLKGSTIGNLITGPFDPTGGLTGGIIGAYKGRNKDEAPAQTYQYDPKTGKILYTNDPNFNQDDDWGSSRRAYEDAARNTGTKPGASNLGTYGRSFIDPRFAFNANFLLKGYGAGALQKSYQDDYSQLMNQLAQENPRATDFYNQGQDYYGRGQDDRSMLLSALGIQKVKLGPGEGGGANTGFGWDTSGMRAMASAATDFDTTIDEITRDWRGMTESDIGTSRGDQLSELDRLRAKYGDIEAQYADTDNYLNTATGPEAQAMQRQIAEQIAQINANPNMTSVQKQRAIQAIQRGGVNDLLTARQSANAQRLQSLTGLLQNQEAQGADYLQQLLAQRQSGRELLGAEDTRNMSAREASLNARAAQAQARTQALLSQLGLLGDMYQTDTGLGYQYSNSYLQNDLERQKLMTDLYGQFMGGMNAAADSGKDKGKSGIGFIDMIADYGGTSMGR